MATLYRCLNPKCADDPSGKLGHDFTADVPVCDKCGVDGRDPRFARVVHRLVVLHYDPPSPVEGIGLGHRACDPSKTSRASSDGMQMATGDPESVNCAKCRETGVWKENHRRTEVFEAADFEVIIDPAKKTFGPAPKAG